MNFTPELMSAGFIAKSLPILTKGGALGIATSGILSTTTLQSDSER